MHRAAEPPVGGVWGLHRHHRNIGIRATTLIWKHILCIVVVVVAEAHGTSIPDGSCSLEALPTLTKHTDIHWIYQWVPNV